MPINQRVTKALLIPVALLSLGACAMFKGQESPGQYTDDAAITAKVKAAFIGDSHVSAMQISVETMQGVVQLSGFVDTQATEVRAVHLANAVSGVKMVKDDLAISPGN